MTDSTLTVLVGTVVKGAPELRFTPQGKAVANFSIRVPGSRKAGTEAFFQDINCWEQLAENVAESLQQGDRVIVRGIVKTRSYENNKGETVEKTELTAWNVGPDLSFATAEITRNERTEAPAEAAAGAAAGPGYESF